MRKITNDRQIMFDCDKVILHYYVSILRESGLNLMLTLTLSKFVTCNDKDIMDTLLALDFRIAFRFICCSVDNYDCMGTSW